MQIPFTIHTYGHGDAMFFVLNGIKMIMNSDFSTSIIKLVAFIATSYYAMLSITEASSGRSTHYFVKSGIMVIIVTSLIMPKADIMVEDVVTGKKDKVTNLPYAFVMPVGILEAFGAGATSLFEQAMTPVGSMQYSKYGMLFGARIVQESKNWKLSNPEFVRNMDGFLKRCVVLEAMIGYRFTPDDVYKDENILELVSKHAGTFRTIDFRRGKDTIRVTCKEAIPYLRSYLDNEINQISRRYGKSDFALAGGIQGGSALFGSSSSSNNLLNQTLLKNLEAGYRSSLGVDAKASDIIRQNMMINSIKDFNNRSDLYGYTRALDSQNSNWFISGELAKQYLPLLLDIMKSLIYASFCFIVPLMILSGGVHKYLKYCMVVFSLQLWPSLNSILNLFIEYYGYAKATGFTDVGTEDKIINFANFNQAHQAIDNIVLVASGLQMSIPFLSFAIVQGGVGGFVHLAGSIQSASSSASAMASGEIVSGNRSFDNISRGLESYDNKSGFKTDYNQTFQEGAIQVQGPSGAIMRRFQDGSESITTGAGTNLSSGSRKLDLSKSVSSSASQHLSSALSALKGEEKNYNDAKTSTISSVSDLVSHIAQRESSGESFNYESLGEEGKSLQQAVNFAKNVHKRDGHSWEQSGQASVSAYADAGVESPIPIFRASAGVRTEGSVALANKSNQSSDRENTATQNLDTNDSFNNLVRASGNENWMRDNSIDSSFADSTRANYDKMQSYSDSISAKKEEVDTYNKVLESSSHIGATDSQDAYHLLEDSLMNDYGVSRMEAHNMIENNDDRSNKAWDKIVDQKMHDISSKINNGKNYVNSLAQTNANEHLNQYSSKVNDQENIKLKDQAKAKGLEKNNIKSEIDRSHEKLHADNYQMRELNFYRNKSAKDFNNEQFEAMDEKANKYEKDRIGQGKAAKIIGGVTNVASLGNTGSNIGGPKFNEKEDSENFNKAIQVVPRQENDD